MLFADVSSFLLISESFALSRHSASLDTIPQDTQTQIKNCSSHISECSDTVWWWLSHFVTYYDFQEICLFYRIIC